MLPSETQAVFFDAVGTLIEPWPLATEVYANVGLRHGMSLMPSDVARRFQQAFQREEEQDRRAGWIVDEDRERRRWQSIVEFVFGSSPHLPALFQELYSHFADPHAWRVCADVGQVLQALSARGCLLGLASNFDHRLHRIADAKPELSFLRRRVISSEAGWRKPAPAFFDAVIRAADCERGKIVFVGDSLQNDFEGAQAAGLVAILLDRRAEAGSRRITRLGELLWPPL